MNETFLWQFFVTRWVILAALALVVGVLVNGVTFVVKKDAEPHKGRAVWWVAFFALTALHTGAFLYHKDLPHWSMCAGAGMIVGFCATMLLYGMSNLLSVRGVWWYALLSALSFPLAIWLGAEKILLTWLK